MRVLDFVEGTRKFSGGFARRTLFTLWSSGRLASRGFVGGLTLGLAAGLLVQERSGRNGFFLGTLFLEQRFGSAGSAALAARRALSLGRVLIVLLDAFSDFGRRLSFFGRRRGSFFGRRGLLVRRGVFVGSRRFFGRLTARRVAGGLVILRSGGGVWFFLVALCTGRSALFGAILFLWSRRSFFGNGFFDLRGFLGGRAVRGLLAGRALLDWDGTAGRLRGWFFHIQIWNKFIIKFIVFH